MSRIFDLPITAEEMFVWKLSLPQEAHEQFYLYLNIQTEAERLQIVAWVNRLAAERSPFLSWSIKIDDDSQMAIVVFVADVQIGTLSSTYEDRITPHMRKVIDNGRRRHED